MLENFDKTELEILTEVHPWQLNLDQSRLCFSALTMEDCSTFRPGRCWDLRTGGYDYVDASVLSWHYNTGTSATAMTGFLGRSSARVRFLCCFFLASWCEAALRTASFGSTLWVVKSLRASGNLEISVNTFSKTIH